MIIILKRKKVLYECIFQLYHHMKNIFNIDQRSNYRFKFTSQYIC